jgi:hypothetical protein
MIPVMRNTILLLIATILVVGCAQYQEPPLPIATGMYYGGEVMRYDPLETAAVIHSLGEAATPRVQTIQVYDPYSSYFNYGYSY